MANITITPAGAAFNPTDTVTSTRLNEARNPTAALVAASIGTADIADAAVTKDKIENISAPLRVLGRTTAGAGVAEEVTINDDDDMANASAITLATDESIKAYVDGTSSFTTEDGQSAGYQVFPSGLKMAWGDAQVAVREDPVTFPAGVNFTVAPTVTITMTDINISRYSPSALNVTTTKFDSYSQVATDKSRYFAIGI